MHFFKTTLTGVWPLLFGLGMIMVGNGLQGTLLSVRATIEMFPTFVTGLIMGFYFVGFLYGSIMVPKLIGKVGHIRVFAALASMASATVLIHALFVDPWVWGIIRLFTGFSYAGLYIVVESWLNDAATNKNRGTLLSLYMIISNAATAIGQGLINVSTPEGMTLFIVTSVIVSCALVPISLSSRPAPHFETPPHVSLKRLFVLSPLGLVGIFFTGIISSTLLTMIPVYAITLNFPVSYLSIIMMAIIFGGAIMQIPIGWLSDKIDRRKVIIITAAIGAVMAFLALLISATQSNLLIFCLFLMGGMCFPLYGLCIAHTNDHIDNKYRVAVSASLILIYGVGACLGPPLISTAMTFGGPTMIFLALSILLAGLCLYGLFRTRLRDMVPSDNQNDYVYMPTRSGPGIMQIVEDE